MPHPSPIIHGLLVRNALLPSSFFPVLLLVPAPAPAPVPASLPLLLQLPPRSPFDVLSAPKVACVIEEGCRASSLRDWRSTGTPRDRRERRFKVPVVPLASHLCHVPFSVQRVYFGTPGLEERCSTVFLGYDECWWLMSYEYDEVAEAG